MVIADHPFPKRLIILPKQVITLPEGVITGPKRERYFGLAVVLRMTSTTGVSLVSFIGDR